MLSKMTTRGVKIIDPAVGEKSLTWNDFRAKFSGTALEIRKAANFVAQKETVRLNHSLYTRQFFRFKISAYIAISAFILSQVLTLSLPYQLQLVVNDLQKGVNEANDNMIAQAYAEALIKLEAKALKTFNQERLLRA